MPARGAGAAEGGGGGAGMYAAAGEGGNGRAGGGAAGVGCCVTVLACGGGGGGADMGKIICPPGAAAAPVLPRAGCTSLSFLKIVKDGGACCARAGVGCGRGTIGCGRGGGGGGGGSAAGVCSACASTGGSFRTRPDADVGGFGTAAAGVTPCTISGRPTAFCSIAFCSGVSWLKRNSISQCEEWSRISPTMPFNSILSRTGWESIFTRSGRPGLRQLRHCVTSSGGKYWNMTLPRQPCSSRIVSRHPRSESSGYDSFIVPCISISWLLDDPFVPSMSRPQPVVLSMQTLSAQYT